MPQEAPCLCRGSCIGYRSPSSVEKKNIEGETKKKIVLPEGGMCSPLAGQIVPLTEVPDAVFASECMGKGVAIEPSEGRVVDLADGTVATMFPTGHAVGLKLDDGRELLIHVGMDTVQLEGKYFKTMVTQGDKVKAGQTLIEFYPEKIRAAGYRTITPVVVTNTGDYEKVSVTNAGSVNFDELLLTTV